MILYNNIKSDSASLTAAGAVANYPVANILDSRLSRIYRVEDIEATIVFNIGSAVDVDCFAMINHNLSSGATITLQGNTSDSWTSPPFEETMTYDADIIKKQFTAGTYQYWRLYINDSTNSDGYIQFARVILAEYYEPPGILAEAEKSLKDNSIVTRSISRQTYGDIRSKQIGLSFNFPIVSYAEASEMIEIFRSLGQYTAIVFTFGEIGLDISSLYATINQDTLTASMYDDGLTYAIDFSILEEK